VRAAAQRVERVHFKRLKEGEKEDDVVVIIIIIIKKKKRVVPHGDLTLETFSIQPET